MIDRSYLQEAGSCNSHRAGAFDLPCHCKVLERYLGSLPPQSKSVSQFEHSIQTSHYCKSFYGSLFCTPTRS